MLKNGQVSSSLYLCMGPKRKLEKKNGKQSREPSLEFPIVYNCIYSDDVYRKLHLAVISQNIDAIMYLIMAAISCTMSLLDLQNYEFRQTALHLAVITNQPAVVRLLVNCGASCDVRDHNGHTALHLACSRGLVQCIVEMMREFSPQERAELEKYCQKAGLPAVKLPSFRLPNLNDIDYEGM